MGISIHYSGRFREADKLPKLIEEVKDIAESYKWDYHIFESEFPAGSLDSSSFDEECYGICFSPPQSEPVCMTFASNGRMVTPWGLEYHLKHKDKDLFMGISTKTHYAGPLVHRVVIHLLDYLSGKYLSEFKLIDEASYWETRDENLLNLKFKHLNEMMDNFVAGLETQPLLKGETFEVYFERLLHKINKDRGMA